MTTRRGDDRRVWALNNIPHVGSTADPSVPLPLPDVDNPPPEFPALADIPGFLAGGGRFLLGEVDGHLVAMGSVCPVGGGCAEVNFVRVHPAARRHGLGRQLMGGLERAAARMGCQHVRLDTATNQPEAIAFYRALGYQEAGTATRPGWHWTLMYFVKDLTATVGQ